MDFLKDLGQKFAARWNELDKNKKILFMALGGTAFFALIISIFFLSRVTYVPLYTGLDSSDAQGVVEHLEAQGIPYQIDDGGQSILVSRDQVHQLRLQMAGQGIPTGGVVGFEVFDTTRLGTTEFERQINFYRALSGELARTISTMNAVENARVQITTPRDRLFAQDEDPVQASVLLEINPLSRLESEQVNSIMYLVAGSVDGLQAENVTVVDTGGTLLSAGLNMDRDSSLTAGATRTNMEMQRLFEKQLQQDLEKMLIPVLGYDNFVANVNALLDFDLREEQAVRYEPVVDDEGIIRSQQVTEEIQEGSSGDPGGVPGTDPNIPLYESPDFMQEMEREFFETVTNYEISEIVSSHIFAPGSLERLSVGIIINQPLDPQQQEQIENVVAAAIGLNEERGDSLSLAQLDFDDSLAQEMELLAAQQEAQRRQELYIYGGAILALTLVVLYIIRRVLNLKKATPSREQQEVYVEKSRESKEEEMTPEERERREIRREVSRLINEKPQEAANLLKTWLVED